MASIVVLFELHPGQAVDPGQGEPAIVAVHAAGADPDVPEDPQASTLCGRDTVAMEHSHYQPRYGEPWYPSALADFRCRECERALRTS
ncbi:hypothetical protein ACFCX4_00290 [Kitasatospora sp. NPDC056327]|uniref:hypothetical protein n=1 Tax=Kitasatospora sp. NPDC056327 TaxID=3345785 RepID=UPI0035D7CB2E